MTRKKRFVIYGLAGLGLGLILGIVAIIIVTRTGPGMERVRRFAVNWLDQRVTGGTVKIGRITGAGLLGGLTLHDFAIVGDSGNAFVDADSLVLEYNWRTLLSGEIKLKAVKLYRPHLVMEQLPGDTAWNYEYIFEDTTPGSSGNRKLIEFDNAQVFNAFVTIRRPLDTDEPIEVADTARLLIEPVRGGKAKVMKFDSVYAEFDRVTWESPIEKGKLFQVKDLKGLAYVWKEPARIRQLSGRLTTRDTIIAFDFPRVEFGGSTAGVLGRVIQEEGQNVFDILIDGKKLVFHDLLWLYPKFPAGGSATLQLRIQTQPHGILWYATNATITAPGTRLAGRFGVVTGDSMYFTDVALTARPINLELLEEILPRKLPLQGLMVGTVELKGPISSLDTKGDLDGRVERQRPVQRSVRVCGGIAAQAGRFVIALRRQGQATPSNRVSWTSSSMLCRSPLPSLQPPTRLSSGYAERRAGRSSSPAARCLSRSPAHSMPSTAGSVRSAHLPDSDSALLPAARSATWPAGRRAGEHRPEL